MRSNSELDLVPLGQLPPLGQVPRRMYAQTIRSSRFGPPRHAFQREIVQIPSLEPDEVLVAVMAAAVNFNNVWAAKGFPLDVIKNRRARGAVEDFHIGGSDGAGIIYQVGSQVSNWNVGDEVVIHGGVWDENDPWIMQGGDPMLSSTVQAWGFETNWGSFAQFCKVKHRQCLRKPSRLTWPEAASYMVSAMTAYRMLHHWQPNTVKPGDVVLVWGGAGGLGSFAIQLARQAGGIPVAVVNSEEKGRYCMEMGAAGFIDRRNFDHWGPLTQDINDVDVFNDWCKKVRAFGKALWAITGKGNNPKIVIEHPGQDTLPTSLFLCDTGGMVVTCAGTTGYLGSIDLRFLWIRQKRVQGSHIANDEEAILVNDLIEQGLLKCSPSKVFDFDEVGEAHQLLSDNRHPPGKMCISVGPV